MLIPTVISPTLLVPNGGELDVDKEVTCLCSHTRRLGDVKLVWADFGDGWGWRALCSQPCFLANFGEGHTL